MELTLPLTTTAAAIDAGSPKMMSGEGVSRIEALTRSLMAGEEAAWREFHAAYAPRLLRYLIVLSAGQCEIAGEALQQTFLRAVKHMRPFDSQDVLWSWLTVLARSACRDELRRNGRRARFLQRWWYSRSATPPLLTESELDDAFLMERLERELEQMPGNDRELLVRKYLRGETVREMAVALGTTEKAIESRLSRARSQLRSRVLERLHE